MVSSSHDFVSIAMLAFVYGIKHGFDADHLATIDGLTRFNTYRRMGWSKLCGLLFSLGHGAVVIVIALLVSFIAGQGTTPEWLKISGAWISIGFLASLGLLNLYTVFSARPDEVVQSTGLKSKIFGRINKVGHPLGVALVGALFALSFDTFSQAAFFAVTASSFGGWHLALLFGLLFTLGMLVTDGINGLWISHLIRRADETARIASRIMSLVVAGLSLLVAGFGMIKLLLPAVDEWSDGKELALGLAVIIIIATSFVVAVRLVRVNFDRA